jgi:hypothetical protein
MQVFLNHEQSASTPATPTRCGQEAAPSTALTPITNMCQRLPAMDTPDREAAAALVEKCEKCQGNPCFGRFSIRTHPDAPDASDASGASPDGFPPGAPDTFAPFYPTAKPPGTSVRSRWHVLCDQARNHCRYLRTHATG